MPMQKKSKPVGKMTHAETAAVAKRDCLSISKPRGTAATSKSSATAN